ncbi:hypothetical protein S40288_05710 [Stachybotrys chartarum IBT 40288]|nr:hypothetical protein S40288_05710 [Stachybotrys chartarum IBT 40288]
MQLGAASSTAGRVALGLLVALPFVLADGDHHDHHHGEAAAEHSHDDSDYPMTYFALPDFAGLIYAHIVLMTIAWVFVLPIVVMFSLARSRYTLGVQFAFLATNALSILLVTIYNSKTPDLYPGNAHHHIGWIVTWVVSAQTLVGLVGWIAGAVKAKKVRHSAEAHAFIPASDSAHQFFSGDGYRLSDDSGQGTEPTTESVRSNSVSTLAEPGEAQALAHGHHKEYDEDDLEELSLSDPPVKGRFALGAAKFVSSRVWRYLDLSYKIVDRIILPFGFIAVLTGIVTYARFFEGHEIFSGLAHWIKGGVFFWLGLFTLGRWSGSFAELGWAWNARPKTTHKWRPSAEFVESALIFVYGASNIFLEHLGSTDSAWSAQDLEHIAITVLFIGGGLSGMLIESTWIRDLLNAPVVQTVQDHAYSDVEREGLEPPESYEFSINPIPALVIMLLGTMMGSHHQAAAISAMVHKQWGNLLLCASLARAFTYVLIYLKPPKSNLPSRPPTELLAAFGLISGGIVFMASSSDTIEGMIHYDLDAMFMFTVTMGMVGLIMAWEVLVLALKGWATRKERFQAKY